MTKKRTKAMMVKMAGRALKDAISHELSGEFEPELFVDDEIRDTYGVDANTVTLLAKILYFVIKKAEYNLRYVAPECKLSKCNCDIFAQSVAADTLVERTVREINEYKFDLNKLANGVGMKYIYQGIFPVSIASHEMMHYSLGRLACLRPLLGAVIEVRDHLLCYEQNQKKK